MARYKTIDLSPRFLAVDLEKQLIPGSFAHAVHHLLDHDFDLSGFDACYRNDETGASAYPPGMLLKIILCAYAEGVVSSRGIERLCREHVTFIALSGDSAPHFTTLAAFVSGLGNDVAKLFAQVLHLCDRQGLIGRQMFAIDGVKLPSNAAKTKSGTRADFIRQADKLEAAAQAMLKCHRQNDQLPVEPDLAEKHARRIERLSNDAAELRQWLAEHPNDRKGSKGSIRKSNRIRTARTVFTMAISRPSSPAPCATAFPAISASNAYGRPTRLRYVRSASSEAKPGQRKRAIPTG